MSKARSNSTVIQAEEPVDAQPLADLRQNAEQAKGLIHKTRGLLAGLVRLSEEDRLHSDGRFRDGEGPILAGVLDVVDSAPQHFTVLADKDGGVDPKRFETELLRDRLERRAILAEVAAELRLLADDLGDHVLYLGDLVRPPVRAAYQIAKPLALHDPQIASKLSAAKDFYTRPARRSAETRRRNAADKK